MSCTIRVNEPAGDGTPIAGEAWNVTVSGNVSDNCTPGQDNKTIKLKYKIGTGDIQEVEKKITPNTNGDFEETLAINIPKDTEGDPIDGEAEVSCDGCDASETSDGFGATIEGGKGRSRRSLLVSHCGISVQRPTAGSGPIQGEEWEVTVTGTVSPHCSPGEEVQIELNYTIGGGEPYKMTEGVKPDAGTGHIEKTFKIRIPDHTSGQTAETVAEVSCEACGTSTVSRPLTRNIGE